MQYMEFGRTVGSFVMLAGFLLNALFLYAISSTIYLFIDIETNTRKIAALLEKSPLSISAQGKESHETSP